MAVPKKRKKLEESIESLGDSVEQGASASSVSAAPKAPKKSSPKQPKVKSEKVDRAFEVVEKIETSEHKSLERQNYYPLNDQGLHVRFKLDLFSIQDILEIGKEKPKERKENSIMIDFTIPYFWNLPVIDQLTKAVVAELKKMKIIQ
ncbi:MAG: hypothetical protein SFU98_14205 [Leptospiraceae bacterium]|nr:hypothetical protein [Leptospiraceae bacterium]